MSGRLARSDGGGVEDDLVVWISLSKAQIGKLPGDNGLRICLQLGAAAERDCVRLKITYAEAVRSNATAASEGFLEPMASFEFPIVGSRTSAVGQTVRRIR